MRQEDRRPGLGRAFYGPAKLMQSTLLLLALAALAVGLYEGGATFYYLLRGEPVVGRVSSIESIGGAGGTRGDGLRFPTIEYHWPPESLDSRWIVSAVPRGDLRAGDGVLVRVLPATPALAREQMPFWWHALAAALMLGGFLAARYLAGRWYALDARFGRAPPGTGAGRHGIFQGPAGWRFTLGCGLPALLLAGLYLYFVPYLRPAELGYLFDRPGRLLHLAAVRGGAMADGTLNRHERRLLEIPGLGPAAAQDGFERALRQADAGTLDRYIAAIADPHIAFPVDMARLPPLLMARQTDILARFLDTGIEVPAAARRQMLAIAERQRSEAKLRVLATHGITREAAAR